MTNKDKKAKSVKPDWEAAPRHKVKEAVNVLHSNSGFGKEDIERLVGIRPGKKQARAKLEAIKHLRNKMLLGLEAK